MRKTLLLLAVVLSGSTIVANGQSTCAQTLRLAQSIYEQGRLNELPQLLQECLKSGFTTAEKVNAYKLLTLTYIYLEEPAMADQNMLALLRTDTEFKINDAVDPAEFVALYKTFRTYPIYRIGGKLGGVASQPSVVTANYLNDGRNSYQYNLGFSGSICAEIPLTRKLSKFTVNPELSFQLLAFDGLNEKAKNAETDTAATTLATESEAWISLPVLVQYNLYQDKKKITNYFISAGLSADYLLSPSIRIISNRESSAAVEENTFNLSEQRNNFNIGALVAAGFKRKIGKGFLIAELRYKMGLKPMLTKADTYENQILVNDYHYVDGIFKLNTLTLSVGYVLNRYKPKKLTLK
jgi:hypothetical protein